MWFKAKNFLTGMVGALIAVCLLLSMWAVSGYGYWEGLNLQSIGLFTAVMLLVSWVILEWLKKIGGRWRILIILTGIWCSMWLQNKSGWLEAIVYFLWLSSSILWWKKSGKELAWGWFFGYVWWQKVINFWVLFEHDWFVLGCPGPKLLEIGLLVYGCYLLKKKR